VFEWPLFFIFWCQKWGAFEGESKKQGWNFCSETQGKQKNHQKTPIKQ